MVVMVPFPPAVPYERLMICPLEVTPVALKSQVTPGIPLTAFLVLTTAAVAGAAVTSDAASAIDATTAPILLFFNILGLSFSHLRLPERKDSNNVVDNILGQKYTVSCPLTL